MITKCYVEIRSIAMGNIVFYKRRVAMRGKLNWNMKKLIIKFMIIVISRFLKRYLKSKRTRAPAYSQALRQIKGGFQGFFVTVRAGTAYRHLFSQVKKKIICNVYY